MNTRFNPTTNAGLHIAHVYIALMNQYLAHATEGLFTVRFDDNMRWTWAQFGGREAMKRNAQQQLAELTWLGIIPDRISYNSHMERNTKLHMAA